MGMYAKLKWNEYNPKVVQKISDDKIRKQAGSTFSLNEWGQKGADIITTATTGGDVQNAVATFTLTVPIVEEIQTEGRSNFSSVSQVIGGNIVNLLERYNKLQASLAGKVNASLTDLFDYQVWDKTEPLRINLEVNLTTKTDVIYDVILPAQSLQALAGLSKSSTGSYAVPGVSLSNASSLKEGNETPASTGITSVTDVSADEERLRNEPLSKFIELSLPMFYSKTMLVVEARPQYSSTSAVTLTGQEYPASCKVTLQLQSLFPMYDGLIFSTGYDNPL
jgi:hypothetical protein